MEQDAKALEMKKKKEEILEKMKSQQTSQQEQEKAELEKQEETAEEVSEEVNESYEQPIETEETQEEEFITEDWQKKFNELNHKYNTLQGIHNKQKDAISSEKELRNRLSQLEENNLKLMQQIMTMQQQPKVEEPKVNPAEEELKSVLNDLYADEKEAEKIFKAFSSYVKSSQPQVPSYEDKFKSIESKLETSEQRLLREQQEKLSLSLSNKFGNKWMEVNRSDDFKAWANDYEPITGKTYAQLHDDAITNLNGKALEAIYSRYFNEAGIETEEQKPKVNPKDKLKKFVSPGKHTASMKTGNEPLTPAQIKNEIQRQLKDLKEGKGGYDPDKLKKLKQQLLNQNK